MINFFTTVISILFWFVIILVPLVAVHELGHLLMSRLFGVKVPEYAIGLPLSKRTFYKRWNGIIWSFYWPLFGGFVRIYGDNDAIDEAWETAKVDPKKAKENYVPNRIQEILANRELNFFLEDNGLEYTKEWQQFDKSGYARGIEIADKTLEKQYKKTYDQLSTLIEWEYDKQLNSNETFFKKNWIQQSLIISGGVLFNIIAAVMLFWILFGGLGISNTLYPVDQFGDLTKNANITATSDFISGAIIKDTTASKAGLQNGDKIYKFAGKNATEIKSQQDFVDLIQANKDQTVEIQYKTSGSDELKTTSTTILKNDKGEYKFGIGNILKEISFKAKNPIAGINMAFNQTGLVVEQTFTVLGDIFKALLPNNDKTVLEYVGGPVAVGSISSKIFGAQGVQGILNIMAAISINLAVLNLLPIPALDGGRWVILTINKITKKRNLKVEAAIISVTFLMMIGLAIFIAFRDVQGVIGGRY